jgi:two-component system OmpR family response regulator
MFIIVDDQGTDKTAALDALLGRLDALGLLVPVARDGDAVGDGRILWQPIDDSRARVAAFTAGAEDVIGPWMPLDEATARVARIARRAAEPQARIEVADLAIDMLAREAKRSGHRLALVRREFDLLLHLARHCGRLQSRADLIRAVWRLGFDPGTNIVEVHVSRLRAKLDHGFDWPMLRTVRGQGYGLVTAPDAMPIAA